MTPSVTAPPPLLFVLLLFFFSIFSTAFLALDRRARSRRREELARRVKTSAEGAHHAEEASAEEDGDGFGSWVPESLASIGEKVASASGLREQLEKRLERGNVSLRTGEFIALSFFAGICGGALFMTIFRSLILAVIGSLIGAAVPHLAVGRMIRRRSAQLHEQLPDILMVLASSLRSGHSFLQSLNLVAQQVSAPAADELGRVVAEVRLGRPTDEALLAMAERVASEDFRWAVLAMNIQREVGGNLAEVLDTIADTVRDREGVRRQVDVLSAEGRLSAKIMVALPFIFGLYMYKVSPGNLELLFTTTMGLVMVIGAGVLLTLGWFWLRKVVKIDV